MQLTVPQMVCERGSHKNSSKSEEQDLAACVCVCVYLCYLCAAVLPDCVSVCVDDRDVNLDFVSDDIQTATL